MTTITKKILFLSILFSIFIWSGCSSKSKEQVSKEVMVTIDRDIENKSYVEYNKYAEKDTEEYGLVADLEVDARIEEAERLSQNSDNEIDSSFVIEDPSWTTKLILDPDAVTAENFVAKAPVISYKHKFDTEFRDTATWRTAKE